MAAGEARTQGTYCISKQVMGAVRVGLSATVERERWRVFRRFLLTFLGHPVVGAFAGLPRVRIKRLAKKLALDASLAERKPHAKEVESLGIVWPFLQLVGTADDVDPQMTRAVGEFLLFACTVESYWETLGRDQASEGAKEFEQQWRETSAPKYAAWTATRTAPLPPSSHLSCSRFSSARGYAQLLEVSSGHVCPDLDPVRPFITDSMAEAVNATHAARVRVGREALEAMLNKELGTDDCRHAFITSQTFMPGAENFLCPCGSLIGFDFLDHAESPAHVLASLMQRFLLLPSVVYLDTACQMARNASRRVPWLVNMSAMASSIDRAHRLQKQHGCSAVFDTDAYPGRSVWHRTSCAEIRHSINKAFKTHLVHLRQDHFIVQMRLLCAFVNRRVSMRRELGKETNHRLACDFFHTQVQSYCDQRSCICANGRRQHAEDAAAAAAAALDLPAAVAVPAPSNAVDTEDAAAAGVAAAAAGLSAAPAAAVVAVPIAAVAAPAVEAARAPAQLAADIHRAVDDAVVAAVTPAVQAAVVAAVPDAADQAAAAVATQLGDSAGQAAVETSYLAAQAAGRRHGGDALGLAAAAGAGQSAACAPLQACMEAAVYAAVKLAVEDAAGASGGAAAVIVGDDVGVAAGLAAVRAAVQAAGIDDRAAACATADRRGHVLDRPEIGQEALQAALRGALRAAGVIAKVENAPGTDREQVGRVVGDGGDGGVGQNGGDGGDEGGGADETGRASVGADASVDQLDGLDVPCVDTEDSSVDGVSSYSACSDDEPGEDSG